MEFFFLLKLIELRRMEKAIVRGNDEIDEDDIIVKFHLLVVKL